MNKNKFHISDKLHILKGHIGEPNHPGSWARLYQGVEADNGFNPKDCIGNVGIDVLERTFPNNRLARVAFVGTFSLDQDKYVVEGLHYLAPHGIMQGRTLGRLVITDVDV